MVCPGYDDKKPLTWLAPNKVKTRTWNRKSALPDKESAANGRPQDGQVDVTKPASGKELVHIFPGYEFRTETCDIIEATLYWNEQIYPYLSLNQLSQSPWVIPVTHVHYMQPPIQHALVAMAIEHRMLRMISRKHDPFVAEVKPRAIQHRSTAVQALNKEIVDERRRTSDLTMSGVVVFMYGDLMGSATASNWRFHLNGFAALVALRGGWEDLCRKVPHMKAVVLFCKIIENFANTTSPADDQMSPVLNSEMKVLIRDTFEIGYYPYLPCPVELFIDIIDINRLRFLASRQGAKGTTQPEAEDLLTKITDFSPESWSESKEKLREEHLMMAQIYQSAVVLFGISSLQSAGAFSSSAGWAAVKKIHPGRLFSLLKTSATSDILKHCATWPIIVAGFEAKSLGSTLRAFLFCRLEEASRDLGVYLPLAAKEVLERFYASPGNQWDDCFDSPRALIT
ncbi:C6 zinc finger domain-containing protein [Colletotrichum graminicola M1.001]|uniref:C6 zinc finger domain-containing protein n=1 Tax=Colletotrichum graminicola (strain M1.001 / M2 / FGSC 10212) TaxID=645133 RepID=E3Q5E8_COLGM|nr:C6 zinc finger domain-containing protein [Colletotrichum graminicola M1.001]EFQ25915.1 C6 zinc finger domain-containing protein [Colletotrichum graminicola M1.001]